MNITNIVRRLLHNEKGFVGYQDKIAEYFSGFSLSIDKVENKLRNVTSGDCLYFKSNSGQQLEALYFSAISIINKNVKNILEIGTGGGANTVILASLFPDAKIHTYDLPSNDRDYSSLAWRKEDVKFYERINKDNIIFHEKNSFFMMQDSLPDFDLVYVDGGHSYPAVAWDTMFAYNKMRSGAFIVFHDYDRPTNDPSRDSNHVKDLIDNYFSKTVEEKIFYLPWAGYDSKARTCILHKK